MNHVYDYFSFQKPRPFSRKFIQDWCVAWWHSGREEDLECDLDDTPSDIGGYATPVSVETPVTSCVSRCTSLNVIKDSTKQQTPPTRIHHVHYDSKTLPSTSSTLPKIGNNRSVSSDSVSYFVDN